MPYVDKEKQRQYHNEYRRKKRLERGLQKVGRKPITDFDSLELRKQNRKEWEKGWTKEYFRNNPTKRLLWTARARAKRKNLDFSIDENDISIPEVCPYLGIPLILQSTKNTPRTYVASLDRIDSSKGYIKGNVEVISWLANTMKNNASEDQLIMFANAVLARYENSCVRR